MLEASSKKRKIDEARKQLDPPKQNDDKGDEDFQILRGMAKSDLDNLLNLDQDFLLRHWSTVTTTLPEESASGNLTLIVGHHLNIPFDVTGQTGAILFNSYGRYFAWALT